MAGLFSVVTGGQKASRLWGLSLVEPKKTCGDESGGEVIKHLPNQSACGLTVAPLPVPGQEAGSEGFFLSFFAQTTSEICAIVMM